MNFVDLQECFEQLIKPPFRSWILFCSCSRYCVRVKTRLQLYNVTVALPSHSTCSVVEHQLINNAMEGSLCNLQWCSLLCLFSSKHLIVFCLLPPCLCCICILTLVFQVTAYGVERKGFFSSMLRDSLSLFMSCIVSTAV